MNWAWFDGKMSIEHYEHEHPLDSLAIEKANASETETGDRERRRERKRTLWAVENKVTREKQCSAAD